MSETSIRARGGCHCGAVRFVVRGKLRDVLICHCSDCRRHHGHARLHPHLRGGLPGPRQAARHRSVPLRQRAA